MADQNTFNRELRGLQSAMKELSIDSGTIVTWDDEADLEGNIRVVPAWKWLLTFEKYILSHWGPKNDKNGKGLIAHKLSIRVSLLWKHLHFSE